MSKLFLCASVFALAFVSCGKGSSGGPVGKWTIDKEAFIESMAKKMEGQPGATPEAIKMMKEAMKGMADKLTASFEFQSDNTFVSSFSSPGEPSKTSKGTWKLEGDKLHIKTTEENGKPPETPDDMTATFKGSTIEMSKDDITLVLKRA